MILSQALCPDTDFCDLLKGMLDYDKKRRLTAREALEHPFILKHAGGSGVAMMGIRQETGMLGG